MTFQWAPGVKGLLIWADINQHKSYCNITFSILSLLFVFLFTHVYMCCEFNVVFWVSAYKCICQYQQSWAIFVLYLVVVWVLVARVSAKNKVLRLTISKPYFTFFCIYYHHLDRYHPTDLDIYHGQAQITMP